MATEECQNISPSLSDTSSESFHGFSENTINDATLPQEARIRIRKSEKIKEKTNKVSLKICFKRDTLTGKVPTINAFEIVEKYFSLNLNISINMKKLTWII